MYWLIYILSQAHQCWDDHPPSKNHLGILYCHWGRGWWAAGKYRFSGLWVAPALPSWKRPQGPAHMIGGSACSAAGALWLEGLCRWWADGTGKAKPRCCAQTQAPGMCMCCQPGSSDRPPPIGEAEPSALLHPLHSSFHDLKQECNSALHWDNKMHCFYSLKLSPVILILSFIPFFIHVVC
jgi:hypothetical protein